MKWQIPTIAILALAIIVLVIMFSSAKKNAASYQNDLTLVAKNYNALAIGSPSELKSDNLAVLSLNSQGFLTANGKDSPL